MIWDVHPGSGSWLFTHPGFWGSKRHRIPDPDPCLFTHPNPGGQKGTPDPGSGSATRMIRSYGTHMGPAGRSCWERRRCDRPPHRATSRTPRVTPQPPSPQPAPATTTSSIGPCIGWRIVQILRQRLRKTTNTAPTIPVLLVQYKHRANPLLSMNNYTPFV